MKLVYASAQRNVFLLDLSVNIWLVEISDFVPGIDEGGRAFRCGMLASELARRGHQVHWWTSTFNHQLRRNRFATSTTATSTGGFTVHFLYGAGYRRSVSIARWIHNRTVAAAFRANSADWAERERPDVVYASVPTLEVAEAAAELASATGVPFCVDVRDLWPDIYLKVLPRWLQPLGRLALTTEIQRARRIMKSASSIVASSRAYLDWGLGFAGRPASSRDMVIPLGAPRLFSHAQLSYRDVRRLRPTLPGRRMILTFAGTFSKLFDFESILAVAGLLERDGLSDVLFNFAGDGVLRPKMEKLSRGLPNVRILGWIGHREVVRLLLSSHVGLAPYNWYIMGTLPNKPFEYMGCGLPVLYGGHSELNSLIADERIGLTYRSGDVRDLMAKILWLRANPEETRAMGRRAHHLYKTRFEERLVYGAFSSHLERLTQSLEAVTLGRPARMGH